MDKSEEVFDYDDAEEKKTHPELLLKLNIVQAEDVMLLSFRKMMNNYRATGRLLNDDKIEFIGNLVLVWDFIAQMVLDKGLSEKDKKYRMLVEGLEFGSQNITLSELIYVKRFVLKCLHDLNIANLFIKEGMSFKEAIDSEY